MFDIGFSEILVIGVVALIVIGPERLPKVARTLGHMFGRLQRYVNEVKADINREMELDELRKLQSQVQSDRSVQMRQMDKQQSELRLQHRCKSQDLVRPKHYQRGQFPLGLRSLQSTQQRIP